MDISLLHSKVSFRLELIFSLSITGIFEMTSKFWSTVTSNANIALKLGSSKHGKQLLASVAAKRVAAPNLNV